MDAKRYQILYALLVKILDDAASISTIIHVGRKGGRMSEGTISIFPWSSNGPCWSFSNTSSHDPVDPGLVRDIMACMIYLFNMMCRSCLGLGI